MVKSSKTRTRSPRPATKPAGDNRQDHLWSLGPPVEILRPDGRTVTKGEPDIAADDLLKMYRWMVSGRVFDERALKLQRQGQIGRASCRERV